MSIRVLHQEIEAHATNIAHKFANNYNYQEPIESYLNICMSGIVHLDESEELSNLVETKFHEIIVKADMIAKTSHTIRQLTQDLQEAQRLRDQQEAVLKFMSQRCACLTNPENSSGEIASNWMEIQKAKAIYLLFMDSLAEDPSIKLSTEEKQTLDSILLQDFFEGADKQIRKIHPDMTRIRIGSSVQLSSKHTSLLLKHYRMIKDCEQNYSKKLQEHDSICGNSYTGMLSYEDDLLAAVDAKENSTMDQAFNAFKGTIDRISSLRKNISELEETLKTLKQNTPKNSRKSFFHFLKNNK